MEIVKRTHESVTFSILLAIDSVVNKKDPDPFNFSIYIFFFFIILSAFSCAKEGKKPNLLCYCLRSTQLELTPLGL